VIVVGGIAGAVNHTKQQTATVWQALPSAPDRLQANARKPLRGAEASANGASVSACIARQAGKLARARRVACAGHGHAGAALP
jgi:uncharacterized membrane protein